jgi:hypothetical protein
MRIAIEAGTHSPRASRVLEVCGHEVLVANPRKVKLIYANKRKTDEIDALRIWLAWHASIRSCSTHFDAPPPKASEQREVRPAVEGQGSKAPTPAPPHEVACVLVQPAMLGGRDLVSRARDQRGQVFAGEPTNLDAKARSLRVELRLVGESCGRRVEEPKQASWWTSAPDSAAIRAP